MFLSCTLKLNQVEITSSKTPIFIKENCVVNLIIEGTSQLKDTSSNENDGVIYLSEGAELIKF